MEPVTNMQISPAALHTSQEAISQPPGTCSASATLKIQQHMLEAVKAGDYKAAFDLATQARAADPKNPIMQDIEALLEEKLSLGGQDAGSDVLDSSSSDGDADEQDSDSQSSSSAEVSDEEAEPSDTDGEGDDVTADGTDTEDDAAARQASPQQSEGYAAEQSPTPTALRLDPSSCGMSAAVRRQLRQQLASDVRKLKEQQLTRKLLDSDPLLSA